MGSKRGMGKIILGVGEERWWFPSGAFPKRRPRFPSQRLTGNVVLPKPCVKGDYLHGPQGHTTWYLETSMIAFSYALGNTRCQGYNKGQSHTRCVPSYLLDPRRVSIKKTLESNGSEQAETKGPLNGHRLDLIETHCGLRPPENEITNPQKPKKWIWGGIWC